MKVSRITITRYNASASWCNYPPGIFNGRQYIQHALYIHPLPYGLYCTIMTVKRSLQPGGRKAKNKSPARSASMIFTGLTVNGPKTEFTV